MKNTDTNADKAYESKIRRKIDKAGFILEKSRVRSIPTLQNHGGYKILDSRRRCVAGDCYQLDLSEVEQWLKENNNNENERDIFKQEEYNEIQDLHWRKGCLENLAVTKGSEFGDIVDTVLNTSYLKYTGISIHQGSLVSYIESDEIYEDEYYKTLCRFDDITDINISRGKVGEGFLKMTITTKLKTIYINEDGEYEIKLHEKYAPKKKRQIKNEFDDDGNDNTW